MLSVALLALQIFNFGIRSRENIHNTVICYITCSHIILTVPNLHLGVTKILVTCLKYQGQPQFNQLLRP